MDNTRIQRNNTPSLSRRGSRPNTIKPIRSNTTTQQYYSTETNISRPTKLGKEPNSDSQIVSTRTHQYSKINPLLFTKWSHQVEHRSRNGKTNTYNVATSQNVTRKPYQSLQQAQKELSLAIHVNWYQNTCQVMPSMPTLKCQKKFSSQALSSQTILHAKNSLLSRLLRRIPKQTRI